MLIPEELNADSSIGEKLVFYKFRADKQTDSYYVLHSLFITKHIKSVSGEVDFLVLAPGEGIFCLEVKHGKVSRDQGKWIFEDKNGKKTVSYKGPFRQVADTMHSLRNWLLSISESKPELHREISRLSFGWGVLFTSLDYFNEYGSEVEPWQVCTNQIMQIQISDFIKALARGWHEKYRGQFWYEESASRPTARICQDIMRLLRGDFSYNYREINRITDQEALIQEFTQEQFDVLDFTDYNKRCLIEGPAGTGKTVLAEELFRRKVNEGKKTALICYNRLLGLKIADNAKTLVPLMDKSYYAGSLHAFMLRQTGAEVKETHDFFSEVLPLEFLIHSESISENNLFDYIIIDEAQDLLTENYLDVIDSMLKGGLRNGAWCCFGDFTGQAIYLNEPAKALEYLGRRTTFARNPPLRINCRNTRRIADQNTLLTGVARAKLNTSLPDGDPVGIYFVSKETITDKVEEVIRILVQQKVPLTKITILSAHRWERTFLDSEYLNRKQKEGLALQTIHSYKGLENSVIILTGFNNLEDEIFRRLMYVGISRARVKLFIILDNEQKPVFSRLIAGNSSLLNS
ncbi:nuclease-related domain-containing DEAD/DEAH box helicase [Rudanella lutea]|uniref:nuclease-related domain-containing DEAD/DEAH box helicase n=1 Tax=Rudanella lutea TaxID=451374 RepID=UPI000379AA8C|nr:NERD domain-containing protein [Rudanella lutea]